MADDVTGLIESIAGQSGRHIPAAGTLNFRDAGGYRVVGGGRVAWRTLLRSDALHLLDGGAAELIAGFGLRSVIDLRTAAETQVAPSPLDDFAERGTLTTHISLLGDDLSGLPGELGEIYDFMIDKRGTAIAAAIRSLSRPGGMPALVHCTAGKDRTGIVIAFVLSALGVPDDIVAADYALSGLYLDPEHTPTIGHVQASTGLGDQFTAALLASPPDLIVRTLDRARGHGGSIAAYLGGHGVTGADLATLRAALVTEDLG